MNSDNELFVFIGLYCYVLNPKHYGEGIYRIVCGALIIPEDMRKINWSGIMHTPVCTTDFWPLNLIAEHATIHARAAIFQDHVLLSSSDFAENTDNNYLITKYINQLDNK